jgi:hypothetical protein
MQVLLFFFFFCVNLIKEERFYTTEILHVLLSLSFAKVSTPTDRKYQNIDKIK